VRAVGVAAESELLQGSITIRSKPKFVEVTSVGPLKPNFALWLDFVNTSIRKSESIEYKGMESPLFDRESFFFDSVDMALVCLAPL
jgi:hypothetical protein